MRIDTILPRGGLPGQAVVVQGDGFGVAQGRVLFDPLGVAIAAAVTSWANDQIQFTVPGGVLNDRFSTLYVEKDGGGDGESEPFWVPAVGVDGLGYQYPNLEGSDEAAINQDDPRVSQASDFNRLMDRLLGVPGGGDMLKAIYDGNNDGFVNRADALDDAGAARTFNDIVALIPTGTLIKGIFPYVASSPSAAELAAALTALHDVGYFVKGPTGSVFHALRRSTLAGGAVQDFALVEMT